MPAPGLPIQIQRTYDSLLRGQSGDFGFGWNLGIKVDLQASPIGDVTLTINGRRRTFLIHSVGRRDFCVLLPAAVHGRAWTVRVAPEHGDNCSGLLVKSRDFYDCAISNPGFVYTDAYGRAYTVDGSGNLEGIQDLSGNTLTVTPAGISSSNGLNVPFVRDGQGRITQITDPLGTSIRDRDWR